MVFIFQSDMSIKMYFYGIYKRDCITQKMSLLLIVCTYKGIPSR